MIFLMDLKVILLDVLYFILRSCLQLVFRPRTKPIDGKLVLITGSGGALGRLFALEYTKHGAEVVLWNVNGEANEDTAKLVRAQGGAGARVHGGCGKTGRRLPHSRPGTEGGGKRCDLPGEQCRGGRR